MVEWWSGGECGASAGLSWITIHKLPNPRVKVSLLVVSLTVFRLTSTEGKIYSNNKNFVPPPPESQRASHQSAPMPMMPAPQDPDRGRPCVGCAAGGAGRHADLNSALLHASSQISSRYRSGCSWPCWPCGVKIRRSQAPVALAGSPCS